MIPIEKGHFCRSSIDIEAGTFDLLSAMPQDSFHGVLDVTLHPARKASGIQTVLRWLGPSQDVTEKVGLDIPPPTVSEIIHLPLLRLIIFISFY